MIKYDTLVFIGRFQPFHNGHKAVIDKALTIAKNVIVLVGGYGKSRTDRNPFSFEQRESMIKGTFQNTNLHVLPLRDFIYSDTEWVTNVQRIVDQKNQQLFGDQKILVGLIGHSKDNSSYYLKLFPEWGSEQVGHIDKLDATQVREMYLLRDYKRHELQDIVVPKATAEIMFGGYYYSEQFSRVKQEALFVQQYKKIWENSPYPVTIACSDPLVQVGGHILLIERKGTPGEGLYALPGGHIDADQTFKVAAIRELKEETRLKVPARVLEGSIVGEKLFDNPNRSSRARVITQVFHIKLQNETSLPEVRGCQKQTKKAFWFPISKLRQDLFFQDHYHIICNMLKI